MSQWEASGTPSTTIPRRLGGAETITRSPRVGRSRRFFLLAITIIACFMYLRPHLFHYQHERSIYLVLINLAN
jgi:hypothetical protein